MENNYYNNDTNNIAMPEGDDIYADPETTLAQGGYGKKQSYAQHPELSEGSQEPEQIDEEVEEPTQEEPANTYEAEEEQEEQEDPEEQEDIKNVPPLAKKEMHFKELRQAKKESDREAKRVRQENEQLRQMMEEQAQYLKQYEKAPAHADLSHLQDGDFLEKRHAQMIMERQRVIEEQMAHQAAVMRNQNAMNSLRNEYPDFDHVVSTENVTRLKERYPALAHSLSLNNDLWSKGKSAYSIIKQYKLDQSYIQPSDNHIKNRIDTNVQKPRSAQSLVKSNRPLQQTEAYSSGLSDAQKKTLLDEVYASAKLF